MQPSWHILLALPLLLLYPFIGIYAIILALSSIVIDADHVQILIKRKTTSWQQIKSIISEKMEAYKNKPKDAFREQLFLFHSIEFNIVLIALSFLFYPLLFVSLGFIYHDLFDVAHHSIRRMPLLRWIFFTYGCYVVRKE
jgi:hypothetical protein